MVQDILNFPAPELALVLKEKLALPSYRATQLLRWLYKRRTRSFAEMTDIAKPVREALGQHFFISRPEVVQTQVSKDGTRKYLFRLSDGTQVESVLIKQPTRYTLCISSQVGCAIACAFCRTGRMGLKRHLQTAEIVGQVLAVRDDIAQRQQAETGNAAFEEAADNFQNIVFMGMGEPFHNLERVISAVKLLNDQNGLNFSGRKITVSTSGLVPAIKTFGESGARANLAVSLNATTDAVRDVLIPINKRWPLPVLLSTLREYPLRPGRRITIEYVMLRDVNDTPADLKRLPQLLHGIPVKINLIPYNDNAGLGYQSPLSENVHRWQQTLLNAGLNSTIRWSKGLDIDAACGQLATVSSTTKRSVVEAQCRRSAVSQSN